MNLYRLAKTDPTSWRVFPDFVARVRAMAMEFSPYLDADVLVSAVEQKFVEAPQLSYFIGVFDDQGQMIGHLAAWIEVSYGSPYVFIAQAQMDGAVLGELAKLALDGLDAWAEGLNEVYARQNSPHRLKYTEMWTPWEPKLWNRYLAKTGRKMRTVRHVIRWDVPLSERHMVQNPKSNG